MPELKSLDLTYVPEKRCWYISSKEGTDTRVQTLYWGANLTPVKLGVHNDLPTPPGALPLKAMVSGGNRPVLGPLIGILSAENQDGSLKGNFNNYKAIMKAGQEIGGIVFAFTPGSVDWKRRIIRGIMFNKNSDQWVKCPFPFPNVVYNRIQDRDHEEGENSRQCIQRFLAHPGTVLYNRGFFNKEEIISILYESPELKRYIPETRALLVKADLAAMLKRHAGIYLKPANNRLGSGIIRVRQSPSKKAFVIHYYAGDKELKKSTAGSIHRLWSMILQHKIPSPYIIQQAIPLAVVSTCPFDCRVLVQKNRQGRWQISGLGVRIAAHAQSITTHVPRGGRIGMPKEVLRLAFPGQKPAQVAKRVHRLCIGIAKKLEQHYRYLGEMSIDVGLDRSGRPWMFEANAKPMKFDEPEIRKQQLAQVIRYSQYLTFKMF